MVVIRLSRGGAKKKPFYHVIAANSRNKRDGKYLEKLGYFNPCAKNLAIRTKLNLDRIAYWESVGAQLSDRVQHIVKTYTPPVENQTNENKQDTITQEEEKSTAVAEQISKSE